MKGATSSDIVGFAASGHISDVPEWYLPT